MVLLGKIFIFHQLYYDALLLSAIAIEPIGTGDPYVSISKWQNASF